MSPPQANQGGTVFVYVLEGTVVRSALNDAPAKDYVTGESWVEPFGATHTLTQNVSDTDKAKILTVFLLNDGAELTTFEKKAE